MPSDSYDGPPRLMVPTARASLTAGEDLRLKVIAVGAKVAAKGNLYWRPLGKGTFEKAPLEHVARSVYSARIPAAQIANHDIEYYVQASVGAGTIRFPATAPVLNQTVVVLR
ncbi:MAG: hypothetical protein M1376_09870 [Planctomycetes bacterium]|nr:hypothetical protein [Planctomycetota bacterium]